MGNGNSTKKNSCIFCEIGNGNSDQFVFSETVNTVVFKDIKPDAEIHLLVIPKEHIVSIKDLKPTLAHIQLLDEIIQSGKQALTYLLETEKSKFSSSTNMTKIIEESQFSFHVPPHTSVNHLHLHVLAGSWTGFKSGYFLFHRATYWAKDAYELLNELKAQFLQHSQQYNQSYENQLNFQNFESYDHSHSRP
eukprot:TRINITY_DN4813_c0_g2_i3.p1 TRINITY_DN4813_c0_g2~~TRINITY_DN4813_c0_g2_i3.p1  ORF type:complete len:192 (+),score=49.90 TRINITY_DN4813_c0_g2_i3:57-632(+)